MKHYYLFVAFSFVAYFYLPIYSYLFLLLGLFIYLWYKFNKIPLIVFLFYVIFFLVFIPNDSTTNTNISKVVKINEIKSNYVIASDGINQVLLYNVDDVSFHDIIKINGNYQQLDSVNNKPLFHFKHYMNVRNIKYMMNVESYEIIQRSSSLKSNFYRYVQTRKAKDLLNYTFFQVKQEGFEDILGSSGASFILLFTWIKKRWKFKKINVQLIIIILIMILLLFLPFPCLLLRLLVKELVSYLFKKYDIFDRLGIEIILMILIRPICVYELAFIIPIYFRFFFAFHNQLNKRLLMILLLIPIQLYYFQSINMFQILLFSLMRYVHLLLFLASLLLLVFDFQFVLTITNFMIQILKINHESFVLYGSISIIYIIIYLYYVIKWMNDSNIKAMLKMIIIIALIFIKPYLNPFGKIVMLDVGQGSCMLIVKPYQQEVIMIDVMGSKYKDIASDIIVPYLKSQGIFKIDTLILTHDDYDHVGGLASLKKQIPINKIIDEQSEMDDYHNLHVTTLSIKRHSEDSNDQSIVTYFNYNGFSMLSMGDLSSQYEDQLIKKYPLLDVDVLVLSHHGSNTSTSSFLLHQLNSKLALVSAGRNNYYNHPSKEVINRLNQEAIPYLCTSKSGSITLYFHKYFAFFMTSDKEFGIINDK